MDTLTYSELIIIDYYWLQLPFLPRTVTSTWSMGRMFAEWQKVLCTLKFEEQK